MLLTTMEGYSRFELDASTLRLNISSIYLC